MHSLRKLTMAAMCCVLLSGCSTFYGNEEGGEVVYHSGEADIGMSYNDMAREMSGGSVQIYGLDGPAAVPMQPDEVYPARYGDGGLASAGDPNVTIYPFEGQMVPMRASQQRIMAPTTQLKPMMPAPYEEMPLSSAPMLRAPVPHDNYPTVAAAPSPAGGEASIYFSHGSSRLDGAGQQVIDHVAQSGAAPLVVEGHASERAEAMDPVARKIANLKVSMDRAFRVSSELIRDGVPAEAIETRAFGDTRPAMGAGVDREAASRRVEIKANGLGGIAPLAAIPPASNERIVLRPPGSAPAVAGSIGDDESAPIPPLARY